MVRKIQNTYYVIVQSDDLKLTMNKNPDCFLIKQFKMESDFTFRKEVTNLPIKKTRLLLDNKIKFDLIQLNLTASLMNYLMEFANIGKVM